MPKRSRLNAALIAALAAKVVAEYLNGMDQATASELAPEALTIADVGRLGGQARARKLTPERRLEIATRASQAAAAKRKALAVARPAPMSAFEARRKGGLAGRGKKKARKARPKKRP